MEAIVALINGDSEEPVITVATLNAIIALLKGGNLDDMMDIDWFAGEQRPVTLLFARERSASGVREALENCRTAIFAENQVYGKEEFLCPLLTGCLEIERVTKSKTRLSVEVFNNSSIPVILDKGPGSEQWQMSRHLVLHPFEHQTVLFYRLDMSQPLDTSSFDFHYTVANWWTAPGEHLHWVMHIEK